MNSVYFFQDDVEGINFSKQCIEIRLIVPCGGGKGLSCVVEIVHSALCVCCVCLMRAVYMSWPVCAVCMLSSVCCVCCPT